jgi:sugar lactone lactonase YvrE
MLTAMSRAVSFLLRRSGLRVIAAVLVTAGGLALAGSEATASRTTTAPAEAVHLLRSDAYGTAALSSTALTSSEGYSSTLAPADATTDLTSSASTLTASASTVGNGANITFYYSTPAATVSSTNWVGIYEPVQVPGQVGSTTYEYAPDLSGTVTISSSSLNGVGPYVAYYFYDNGYQELAGPVDFTVVGEPPAPAPQFVRTFSPVGGAALNDPFGVAVDAGGDVWVADTGDNRVEELSPNGHPLAVLGSGSLDQPQGIALGPNGNLWVTDTGDNRLVEFSPGGAVLASVGGAGPGNGQFDNPTAVTVSSGGNVYVADQDNNRVEEFSSTGAYLSSISVATPDGVAVDSTGNVWVSSPSYADGNAVYEFSPSGANITTFGTVQASFGAFSNTSGIVVTGSGLIVVVQQDYGWATAFDPDGSFNTEFGLQPGTGAAAAREDLEFPQGIAISPAGNIYVADSGNNRVVEYTPPPSWNEAAK